MRRSQRCPAAVAYEEDGRFRFRHLSPYFNRGWGHSVRYTTRHVIFELIFVPKLFVTDGTRVELCRFHAHISQMYRQVTLVLERFSARFTIHRLSLRVHVPYMLPKDVLIAHHLTAGRARHGGGGAQTLVMLLHVFL